MAEPSRPFGVILTELVDVTEQLNELKARHRALVIEADEHVVAFTPGATRVKIAVFADLYPSTMYRWLKSAGHPVT